MVVLYNNRQWEKKTEKKNSPTRKTAVINTSQPITVTGVLFAVLKLVQIKQHFLVEQVFLLSACQVMMIVDVPTALGTFYCSVSLLPW